MNNSYYIQPGGNAGPGLSGLADVLTQVGEQKRQREQEEAAAEAERAAQAEWQQAIDSDDPNQVHTVAIKYPKYADQIYKGFGIKEDARKGVLAGHLRELATATPDQIPSVFERRISEGQLAGKDMSETIGEYEEFKANPEAYAKTLPLAYAAVASPQEWSAFQESIKIADPKEVTASAVTKILPNGTTIQAMSDGNTVVKNARGQVLEGEARERAVEEARQSELDFERIKYGERAAGKQGVEMSGQLFEQIAPVKKSISNMDDAIAALDAGAETGPIISKLPSMRSSSVELDNIQKRMGLDVVGQTTFGALSKGELDTALSTALPTDLRPKELREWIVKKKAAQQKLAAYLEDAAIYLGMPGNTVSGWMQEQRELEKLRKDSGADLNLQEMSDEDLFKP